MSISKVCDVISTLKFRLQSSIMSQAGAYWPFLKLEAYNLYLRLDHRRSVPFGNDGLGFGVWMFHSKLVRLRKSTFFSFARFLRFFSS